MIWGASVVVVVACGLILALVAKIGAYIDPFHAKVAAAGYVMKTAQVNRVALSYAEGPDNGPPLVLLHAQHLDWFSYSRVMPALAQSFHVYVVDYPGHGATRMPSDYPMTADQIGADLGEFIKLRIGQPAFISGNSSGGLLATWLAANRPQVTRAVLLEDPPLFSAEYPRIRKTIADKSFAISHKAAMQRTDDFLLYWIDATSQFFTRNVGSGTALLLSGAIKVYRLVHPGAPVEISLLNNDTVRLLLRGLDQYDPRFGAAFHDGSWHYGFDHATALAKIACPTLLMQASTSTLPDGTLDGAMSEADATRAIGLLKHGRFVKVDATHVVNLDKPDDFVRILKSFFAER